MTRIRSQSGPKADSEIDHAALDNREWSNAGHTIDEDFDFNSHKGVNVVDPTANQDVSTKKYVDDKFATFAAGGHVVLPHYSYDSVVQGTWAIVVSTSQVGNGVLHNASQVNGDEVEFKCFLGAGTYTLKLLGITASSRGITDIYIDDTEVASFDWYSATATYNVIKTQASISVASSGVKTIKLKLDGKNASSTHYYATITSMIFYRTA